MYFDFLQNNALSFMVAEVNILQLFLPSLIFAGKAWVYPSEAPKVFRCNSKILVSPLAEKFSDKTFLSATIKEKNKQLLQFYCPTNAIFSLLIVAKIKCFTSFLILVWYLENTQVDMSYLKKIEKADERKDIWKE